MSSLPQVIRRTVQVCGGVTATRFNGRARTWTEFQERISRLAGGLHSLGVKEGDRAACLALNSDRYMEFYFGVAWSGAVFVPINNRLAPAEILYWLNDSGSSVLFVDAAYLAPIAEIRDRLETVEHFVYLGEDEAPQGFLSFEELVAGNEPVAATRRSGNDLAGIFYTGGTTGRSKGVMLSHRNLTYNVLQSLPILRMAAGDIYLHAAPMFHAADGFGMMVATTMGCTHVFVPAFEPGRVLQTLQDEGVSYVLLVPTMVNMLVNHPQLAEYDLSRLKQIFYGASPMPEAVLLKAMEVLPHISFVQAYGQTEASPVVTLLGPEYHTSSGPYAGKLKAAGKAIPGTDLAIMDDQDNPLPQGEVGEICIRGDNVMLGYWNQPGMTAEALRGGWLHTGDGGRLDEDGVLFVVDRVKDMIVSGGENVYSAETEQAIYTHPAIEECAVIGIPHDSWGEKVHAIVRLKEGEWVTELELIDHCKTLIAAFKCPKSIEFREDPLPLSGAGKILKKDLRAVYWEGRGRNVG
jgi:long-chain acyl-CoA synthetase